jgi:hypothetical protein
MLCRVRAHGMNWGGVPQHYLHGTHEMIVMEHLSLIDFGCSENRVPYINSHV